ncbi:MAG: ASCH domain-containing protein [Burkholderiales bacterium]
MDVRIVLRADGAPVAIIELTEARLVPFRTVDAQYAADEGEGDGTLAWWQAAHREYFRRVSAKLGREFDEDTPVICQRFRVVWSG